MLKDVKITCILYGNFDRVATPKKPLSNTLLMSFNRLHVSGRFNVEVLTAI